MYLNYDGQRYEIQRAIIDDAGSGDNELVAAVTNKQIVVIHYSMIASAAVNARFESGAGGDALTGQMNLTTNSGISDRFEKGLFETNAGESLNLELSGAVSVDGYLSYILV